MKPRILVLLFILFSFSLGAQNWKPVHTGHTHIYYPFGHAFDTAQVHIRPDSFSVAAGDTTFYLNRIQQYINGGASYALINQPQFLMRKIICHPGGNFETADTCTYYFRPYQPLNTPWLFAPSQSLTAQIISRQYSQVFGIPDSILTMVLSIGDTIKMSKSFGIIQIPVTVGSQTILHLKGISGTPHGVQLPGIQTMFSLLQPGDRLQYRTLDLIRNYPTYSNHDYLIYRNDSILSISSTSAQVSILVYRISQIIDQLHDDTLTPDTSIVTLNYTAQSSKFFDLPSRKIVLDSGGIYYSSQFIAYVNSPIMRYAMYDTNTTFGCHTVFTSARFNNNTVTANVYGSDTVDWTPQCMMGTGWYGTIPGFRSERWFEGIGLARRTNSLDGSAYEMLIDDSLISCRLGGTTFGTPQWAPIIYSPPPAYAYPSPTSGLIHYITNTVQGYGISIYNSQGIIVAQDIVNATHTIDVSALPAGLYFISIPYTPTQRFVRQ